MKKQEKIDIIRWYISQYCCLSDIQTKKNETDDLKDLEKLIRTDKGTVIHTYECSTCWYDNRDYCDKCANCKDGSNYTFPYGYWKKVYERSKCV